MSMCRRALPNHLSCLLLGGTVLLSGSLSWPLMATETAQEASSSNDDKRPSSTKPDAAKAKLLGNITVTAQSRTQEMEQVPIPLQIITSKEIDTLAATDLSKMSLFVPGLTAIATQPTQPHYSLRGISTQDFGIGTESAVGVYVDGVYAARSGGALLAFNDIQRIEVLKGPQGTLFGRNAAGGAISIVTNEPSDKLEGKAVVRIGNEGERYENALLNVPLNSDMALRLSVLDNQSDGWIRNQANGQHYGKNDDWGSRAVYRWNITPDTRVLLSWDHERLNQPPQPGIGLVAMSNDTNQRPAFPPDPSTYLDPLHARLYNDAVNAAETRRFDGSTLIIDHSFPWGSFTSTTAWRRFNTFNDEDNDGTDHIVTYLDTANIEHNNSWYQEFKLSGSNDLMDWVTGASWYNEQARQASQVNIFTDSVDTLGLNVGGEDQNGTFGYFQSLLNAFGLPYKLLGDPWREQIDNDGNFKAYAAFGDVIWHLSDKLDLTTGLRFTRDQKEFSWYTLPRQASQLDKTLDELDQAGLLAIAAQLSGETVQQLRQSMSSNLIFNAAAGDPVGVPVTLRSSWSDISPRAVLSYKFTPDVMAYASITKGYKAGGYNSLEVGSRYAPEKVWNYEIGLKSVLPQYNLLFNASVYHYRYSNLQSSVIDPNSTGSGVPFYIVNNSDEEATGVEFEAQWQPVEALRINLTGAYIDSTYLKAISTSGQDLAGQPTGEPLFSATAGMAYTWHDIARGDLEFDFQYGFRGRTRCNDDSVEQGTCGVSPNFVVGAAQRLADARLDWHTPDDRWGVALYADNLFNNRYVLGVGNYTTDVFGTNYATITPPRTWGLELRAKF